MVIKPVTRPPHTPDMAAIASMNPLVSPAPILVRGAGGGEVIHHGYGGGGWGGGDDEGGGNGRGGYVCECVGGMASTRISVAGGPNLRIS